jgi:hypothetical protein
MSDPALNRLQSELHRLYLPPAPDAGAGPTAPGGPPLIDAQGQVRALVLALAGPADWALLSRVWHGVQAELELPAPAIAVAGADGYQLWFSLVEPVPVPQAQLFLDALRRHYLGDVKPSRVGLLPAVAATSPGQVAHARPVPAQLPGSGHWSAFVAPDLAPVFADEPWLDSAPNPVGQSDLLSRLTSMPAADFERVLDRLQPNPVGTDTQRAAGTAASTGSDTGAGAGTATTTEAAQDRPTPLAAGRDPKRFLLDVMNDEAVALGLRIDAAKALLPYVDDPRAR